MTSSPWAKWLLAWVPVIGFVATGVTLSTQTPEPATYAGDGTRVAAAVTAAREGLPYLPGEVLVQFKSGTAVTQMAGALRVLRSRPDAENIRWIGDTMLLTGLAGDDPADSPALLVLPAGTTNTVTD